MDNRKSASLDVFHDDLGDEESGDDKEDVNTDEAASEAGNARVEENDRHDSDCTKTINIGTI
jgi:hypothetical protein